MTPLDLLRRGYRRLARPLGRGLVRGRDVGRLRRFLGRYWDRARPPVFVIVLPNTIGWLEPCLKLVAPEVPLFLIANGLSKRARRELAGRFPQRPVFALSTPPDAYARHGTVLDLLIAGTPGDLMILDHDCYLFDPAPLAPVAWKPGEFIAAIDRPGFSTVNRTSGLRFPRTHFLILHGALMRDLRRRFGVGCEKVLYTPRGLVERLAAVGIGDHNYPPALMPFFDTLQLAMAVAFAEGWRVRWLPVADGGIAHIGGTARARNQPGLRPAGEE